MIIAILLSNMVVSCAYICTLVLLGTYHAALFGHVYLNFCLGCAVLIFAFMHYYAHNLAIGIGMWFLAHM
jgi:hypothetical protein